MDRARGVRSGADLPLAQLAELLVDRRGAYLDLTTATYPGRLQGLAYRARTLLEETGANNLYLALGSLVWDLDGRHLRSPLILVPVLLRAPSRGGRYRIVLDEAGSSTPNYCLVEKLRQVYGLEIPGLANPVADDAGIDLAAVFHATRTAIAERGLSFRVEPTADLAVLQFAKFRLWKDLDENWAEFTANPLVDHLVGTPTETFADPVPGALVHDLEGLAEQCPVPADSSQLRAVAEAVGGRTFVLEGPPGTGKSQTITNLLAHAVAEGKRVLFVAEKRAALDVVQRRLDAIGMAPLSLDLHDRASSPAAVRAQIKRALEHTVVTDARGTAATLDELRSTRRVLTRYAYNLHDRNAAGLSLHSARDAELAVGEVGVLPIPEHWPANTGPDAVARVRRALDELPDVSHPARPRPDHPWAFVDTAAVDVDAVLAAARTLDAALAALPCTGAITEALAAVRVLDDLRALVRLATVQAPLHVLDEVRTPRWSGAVDAVRGAVARFVEAPHPGLDQVTSQALDLPLPEIHAAARAAAASGFFGRRKRLRAALAPLAPTLRPGVAVPPKKVLDLTTALMAVRDRVHALAAEVAAVPGLGVPPGWNPFHPQVWPAVAHRVEHLRRAAATVDPAADPAWARFAQAARALHTSGDRPDPAPIGHAADAAEKFVLACRTSPEALARWAGDGLLAAWTRSRGDRALADDRLGSLRRWLALVAVVEPLRAEGLGEARTALLRGELDADDAVRAFERGLAIASRRERRTATGLDVFDVTAHERGIARFTAAAEMLREHLATAVPHRILRSRPFDPAASGGRVGLLHRQLTRSRGGLKVRELMTRFGDLITQALPCVLVSPDSVARFFPPTAGLFDIVVFDEASQVRVADAIGAMGRGRSVVVVGDSKQMPPTSFAESVLAAPDSDPDGMGPDGMNGAVEDEESILTECVQARVERHRLTWHYRSQDESLIAFSNHHYYDGALSSFPAPTGRTSRGRTGISLVRVDGHFHRSGPADRLRTNPVEAEAVVAEIRRRFAAVPMLDPASRSSVPMLDPASRPSVPSLGVVTFNQQQRALVELLLRDSDDPRIVEALDDPEGLFVKNLENVQGDERDTVFFSTAFSVNARGVLPLNFGPLNRAGGERRLNVAVTRARREVVVFSSFDPTQLRAEETSSVGIKHLRTYLDVAAGGADALPVDPAKRVRPDRHRDQVADALCAEGLAVRTAVGRSEFTLDLVLADPGAPDIPVVAVLLDGPTWATRLTAYDRDALPSTVLKGMLGWPAVERLWLPDWLDAPHDTITRLLRVVAGAHAPEATGDNAASPLLGDPPAVDPDPVPEPSGLAPAAEAPAPRHFSPWQPTQLGTVDVLDALPAPAAVARVEAALADVVAAEGPVHLDRVVKLVAGAFGLSRVVAARRAAILRHLPPTLHVDGAEPVVWPSGLDPMTWTGYRRTEPGVERRFDHVPLREIVNAMTTVARASAGMATMELQRELLAVFGGRNRTAATVKRLDAALALGVESGRLRASDGIVWAV